MTPPRLPLTQHEERVRVRLEPELAHYNALVGNVYDCLTLAAEAFARVPDPPPVAKLQALLVARLMADLRVCQWASTHGYVMQALTLASAIHEIGYGLIYLGDSNDRAKAWVEHDSLKRTYPECGHRQVISDVKKYFPLSGRTCAWS